MKVRNQHSAVVEHEGATNQKVKTNILVVLHPFCQQITPKLNLTAVEDK